MHYYLLIILISVSSASIYPINDKINFSLNDSIYQTNDSQNKTPARTLKAMLFSGILPGAGQYYLGDKTSSYIFLGIESFLVGVAIILDNEGNTIRQEYKEYAEKHWNFADWINNYNYWKEDLDVYDAFSGYPDIWDDGHHINFISGANYYSSNDLEFELFINELELCSYEDSFNPFESCNSTINNAQLFYAPGDGVIKDHNFYENIGKYPTFFAGWDDSTTDFYSFVKPNSGETLAYSPNKRTYWNLFEDADEIYRIANYSLSAILANHVSSIFHALIIGKPNINKTTKYSFSTMFDPNSDNGIGGVHISIRW